MWNLIPTELWNYSFSDLIYGLSVSMSHRKSPETLVLPGIGKCIPTRSARAAIIIAIKALNLRRGASIGVPLYCCPVVFKAIQAAQCTPRFIDIDPETFCISPSDLFIKRSQLDAVIAVHMFGHLCDMPSLQESMKDKPIIEDCAQSLGSKLDGRAAGTFGSVAAFSFRSGKNLSVGEGGAIFADQEDLFSRISQLHNSMPAPSRAQECQHTLTTYVRSKLRSKPLWGMVGSPLWSTYNKAVDFTAKSPIVLSRPLRTDLAIALDRLSQLNHIVERQRVNAEYYAKNLRLGPKMLSFERAGTYYNRYLFPITFPSSELRDSVAAYLKSQMISSSKPYQDVVEGAAEYYGYDGDCPITEKVSKRVLVVPSYFNLRSKDTERIARCINEGWKRISR